jgi:curved DNA-binding protein CbpA
MSLMNYKTALEILEIDMSEKKYSDINLEYLKKQYHKLALQNHPDKNGNTKESKEKFQVINEAYDYLKREINFNEQGEKSTTTSTVYADILQSFLSEIFDGKYNDKFYEIIKKIIVKKIPNKLFKELNKEMAFDIYNFLSKYKNILHINQELLDSLMEIVYKKYEDVMEYYKLNPSIDDLFENNVYKLYVNEQLFLVPLWHNELYFESSEVNNFKEIIVSCEPELSKNIKIDENNNLVVKIEFNLNDLLNLILNDGKIFFNIGKKELSIPVNKLYMKLNQYYRIKNEGLSKINENDIYDVSNKSDIIVNITLI